MLKKQTHYCIPVQQKNYSGLEYLDPNNLNQKIKEEENPKPFELPAVLPEKNVYYPKRVPSDNLSMTNPNPTNVVPLHYKTYDQLDSRNGSAVFFAPMENVVKLKPVGADITENYLNGLSAGDL